MPPKKLQNYLCTYRKRFGLTQQEVAFLLGCKSPAKVSRYERFARLPTLETALAFEALFGVPVAELFAGVYEQVEQETSKRARTLAQQLQRTSPDTESTSKKNLLRAIEVTPDIVKENS